MTNPPVERRVAEPFWQLVTIFVFGVVFISVILVVAIWVPNPVAFQKLVFGLVAALAAAGIAALIPGRFGFATPAGVKAIGAIAVFGAVFYAFLTLPAAVPPPDLRGRFPGQLETGWIFAGYVNKESGKFSEGPYANLAKDPKIDPVFVAGNQIEILANRELIIKNYKSADADPLASPITIPGGVLRPADRTAVTIEEGKLWVVRDVSRGNFIGNIQQAVWLRISEIP